MKNLMIIFILVISANVFAESITVLETRVPRTTFRSNANAKFFMDSTTGEGSAKVSVTDWEYRRPFPGPVRCDRYGRCFPERRQPIPTPISLYNKTVVIRGLNLVNKQMIYSSSNGDINCGRLGSSRVLGRATLYLTGNCKLETTLNQDNLTVNLTVK